ncbi:Lysophosphatidic acid:oleoyl-CoA acyltransferase 1 [Basidiobolus ranarum]|uniref:Lysophosphatidic acid:oleoyl-CoA acyltransferase 1 n=1 Tax=Basidiobolus ranarum TaxID=34480 RepID=A0ABR2W765_9FUNG
MEKYSRWRDASTGIQPFLPPVPLRTEANPLITLHKTLKDYLLGPLIFGVRLVGILLCSLLIALFEFCLNFVPNGHLRRQFRRVLISPFSRLLLLFTGFYWISSELSSIRKGRGQGATRKKTTDTGVKSGDIIVANHTSYIDIIYLYFRYDPVFTQIYSSKSVVRPLSFWSALKECGTYPEIEPKSKVQTYTLSELCDIAKEQGRGPLVVFPEGTTSNGRALLKFTSIFDGLDIQKIRIHIVALKYVYEDYAPVYTVGSRLFHFFRLCSQYNNSLTVKRLNPADASLTDTVEASGSSNEEAASLKINSLFSQVARLRKVNLGVLDKRDFLEFYWSRTNSKYRQEQKKR